MNHSFNPQTIVKEILTIVNEAPQYGKGVKTLAHYQPSENRIIIDYIFVPAILRRKNIATEILQEFQILSEATNTSLAVLPSTEFGTPRKVLLQLYTMAGFQPENNSDYLVYHR